MIDPQLRRDVQLAEGCKLTAYQDTLGWWTIGYGHFIGEHDCSNVVWTQDQADAQLEMDLELAQSYAMMLPEWKFLDTPCRQNAVTELEFNMGNKWLEFTHTRTAIRLQHWQAAHDGLLDSVWATQVGPTRANRLADYLLKGVYA